jgi:hypothetical protein
MDRTQKIKDLMRNSKVKFPQAQYSTDEQIQELLSVGNLIGLYDAVDALKTIIENNKKHQLKQKDKLT